MQFQIALRLDKFTVNEHVDEIKQRMGVVRQIFKVKTSITPNIKPEIFSGGGNFSSRSDLEQRFTACKSNSV